MHFTFQKDFTFDKKKSKIKFIIEAVKTVNDQIRLKFS